MSSRLGPRRGAGSASIIALAAAALATAAAAQTPPPVQTPPSAAAPVAAASSPTGTPAGKSRPRRPAAQPASDEDDPEDSLHAKGTRVEGVDVVAHKTYAQQYGAVVGDIEPEIQYTPAEIQSFGVSTVTDLLGELAPETRSDRGRGGESPVILVNGRRISSINEVQNIPTEAILRIDILPEEVSLKYGYTADQRVVNIVLRRRFHATTIEAAGGGPTAGGEVTGKAEVDLLHIRRDNRLNLDLKYAGASNITDADRTIVEPTPAIPYDLTGNVVSATPGGQIDPALSALAGRPVNIAGVPVGAGGRALTLGDFVPTAGAANVTPVGDDRTLSPATQSLTANAVLTRPLPDGVLATINGTLAFTSSDSLRGLPGVGLNVPPGDPFSPFATPVVVDRYLDRPLNQYALGWTAHLGSTLNKDAGDWRLSLTDAFDHADTQTDTDTGVDAAGLQALLAARSGAFNPFGPLPAASLASLPQSYARSIADSANIQILANGPLFRLPAGNVYVSGKVGDTQSWQGSTSARMGEDQSTYLTRNDGNAQLNIDLPLTSRRHHVLPVFGELSVNANADIDQLSDFGTLKAFGYGVNWTPVPGYNLIVSHTNDQAAPTIAQLGAPTIVTPGVPVFDYSTGQTVDVTQIGGGDPHLIHDNRNVTKIGLTLKPIPTQDLTITANYIKSDIDNPIETFPAASAAIEAAFPARFVRDAQGQLVEEDIRAVNFARSERAELRWGLNYSRPIGKQPPPRRPFPGLEALRRARAAAGGGPGPGGAGAPGGADAGPPGGDPGGGPGGGSRAAGGGGPGGFGGGGYGGGGFGGGGGGGFGGGGRGGFGRFGGGGPPTGGRLQVAVYHTMIFTDRLLVSQGGPTLDLLNGAAASGTGGQYRNEIEGQLGVTLGGYGVRLSEDWHEGTVVQGVAGVPTGDLRFSGITTLNLRLWDNLGQQRAVLKRFPYLRGARVTLAITNLLDERVRVRDSLGVTPLAYQPGYIDPVGRAITLSVRKLFY
jgi:hypothetical protein